MNEIACSLQTLEYLQDNMPDISHNELFDHLKKYNTTNITKEQVFDPALYVASHFHVIHQFIKDDIFDTDFVTFVYIVYGFRNKLKISHLSHKLEHNISFQFYYSCRKDTRI